MTRHTIILEFETSKLDISILEKSRSKPSDKLLFIFTVLMDPFVLIKLYDPHIKNNYYG